MHVDGSINPLRDLETFNLELIFSDIEILERRIVKVSNAIVIAKDGASVGIGVGQTSRVWAMQQAIEHGGENVKGAAVASDAFFPFRDCVDLCAAAGVKSIIQPGGSIRDQESIDACNENGIAMLFCKNRHFKH